MKTLHLFAGIGGGLLADMILGHTPLGAVEINPYCCAVLRERFPGTQIHEQDIRQFDSSEYAGRVDCVSGGFPCQDISIAGKGAGLDGERSGLWSEFARIIRHIRPKYAFIENSPMLAIRGLDRVLSDLAEMGFDAEWATVSAACVGAPHKRERIWIMAYANGVDDGFQHDGAPEAVWSTTRCAKGIGDPEQTVGWWDDEPRVDRVAYGISNRMDRLKALGNGQVPIQAALAVKVLTHEKNNRCSTKGSSQV